MYIAPVWGKHPHGVIFFHFKGIGLQRISLISEESGWRD